MSATQSNSVHGTARQMNAVQAPPTRVQPSGPNPNDIVEIKIKMPRQYYDAFSGFAQFLHKQPAQNPQTGEVMRDKVTQQPIPSLAQPNVETYFMTCALNTYQAYQYVLQVAKQREAQAQQTQAPQQR